MKAWRSATAAVGGRGADLSTIVLMSPRRSAAFIARQREAGQGAMMLAGLPVAIALLAEAAGAAPPQPPPAANVSPTYGPTLPAPAKPPEPVKVAEAEVNAAERCVSAPA